MILCYASGWLLFDENYLLLGCNYLSDYSPETFLSKHLGAFERLKCTCSFRFTRRDTEIFICLFVSTAFLTRYIIDSGGLSRLVHCLLIVEANISLYIPCNCLCSSYAACAWGSIFFYVSSFVCTHHRQYIVLLWPYEFYLRGLRNCQ